MDYLTEFNVSAQIGIAAILLGPYSLHKSTRDGQVWGENDFFFIVIWFVVSFYPYLSKKSKHYSVSGEFISYFYDK